MHHAPRVSFTSTDPWLGTALATKLPLLVPSAVLLHKSRTRTLAPAESPSMSHVCARRHAAQNVVASK
jgi:hypothetical protein